MKYFLTSNPLLVKEQKLNPNNRFVEKLKSNIPNLAKVLFVCSNPHSYELTDKFSDEMRFCFYNSGFNFIEYNVLDDRTVQKKHQLISEADVLILAGGHVPTQNKFFHEIDLKNELKNTDKVIIGFSAGSMNCAEEVYAQPDLEGESISLSYKRFLKGLDITKSQILPHYNLIKDDYLDGKKLFEEITYPDSFGREFIAIEDGSYIFGDGKTEKICGEAYLISNGGIKKVSST
ncbi:Type 1 glutamine amidotransferase-like domain-containing protein [Streptococcus uberis]|uniref:Type 1 glutamine amidotransferase-like domain-containing protein n=1 Tax=Streptococcus uberis TaxID=1349 RepID=UPI00193A01EA|nr:Type 1 glutamine amidotransferase-like domain-containing protein [Streptococcus uberis]